MVPTGGSDLGRVLGRMLSRDIAHAGRRPSLGARGLRQRPRARQEATATRPTEGIGKRARNIDGHVGHECGLRRVARRDDERLEAVVLRGEQRRNNAGHGTHRAVEAQLPEEERCLQTAHDIAGEPEAAQLFFLFRKPRGENGQCNGQIEVRAGLGQARGRHGHDDLRLWPRQRAIRHGGANPRARLADSGIGHTHDLNAGQAHPDVRLDVDRMREHAVEGRRRGLTQRHVRLLRNSPRQSRRRGR